MAFGEVCPALLWRFDREICIQIAIFTLGGRDQFNHLVGSFSSPASGFWHSDQATASSHFATSLS